MQPVYTIPFVLKLSGEINPAALQAALTEIVRRHTLLRTTFAADANNQIRQTIHAAGPVAFDFVDLTGGTFAAQHDAERTEQIPAQLHAQLQQAAAYRFDLTKLPLLRATLIKTAAAEFQLCLAMHHIICDGQTLAALGQEWGQLYHEALAYFASHPGEENAATMPELLASLAAHAPTAPLQYADYALWQRQNVQSQQAELSSFWRTEFASMPSYLELPTDGQRTEQAAFSGQSHYFTIPHPLIERLQDLARQEETTLFSLLLSSWQVLLARLSGNVDFCIGTAASGRHQPGLESLYGYLIHILPLRCQLAAGTSFLDLLKQTTERSTAALKHQDYPFESIVKDTKAWQTSGNYPLFPVMMVLEEDPALAWHFAGVQCENIPLDNQTAKFEMLMSLLNTPHGLRVQCEYRNDLFTAARIERMSAQWQNILEQVAADPQLCWDQLNFLTPAEQQLLAPPAVKSLVESTSRTTAKCA